MEPIEIHKVEEEEGSSFTSGKDDHEGDDADDENQVDDAPEEQTKQQIVIRDKERKPINVEESVPGGNREEETIPSVAEDEVQIFLPPAPIQQTPVFILRLWTII